jgi:N-acetylgalactosamine-6-sulfatase
MKHTLTLITALLFAPLAALHAAAATKPNIVFIYADDWGWGDLACHGNTWQKTPNVDRLAQEGMSFRQFNVLSPVCSPSRVAATTGQFPARYSFLYALMSPEENRKIGQPDWLDPKAPTLFRFLKTAGYRTAHVGKWHMGKDANTQMSAYGVDVSTVYHGPGPQLSKRTVGEHAVKTIEELKQRQPFYLNVWIPQTHRAIQPGQASMDLFKELDPQRQAYAAWIYEGDQIVGRVLDALRKAGMEQNTIVIFSSDNGPAGREWKPDASPSTTGDGAAKKVNDRDLSVGSTGGLRGRKGTLFEGGVRTPFIVRWPGQVPANTTNETTVLTAVDLLPTLCAAAGAVLPDDYRGDGENLIEAWQGKAISRTKPIFWKVQAGFAMRDGEWKLFADTKGKQVELYNVVQDRAETKELSQQHPEVIARMTQALNAWKETLPKTPNPDCVSKNPGTGSEESSQETESPAPTIKAPVRDRNGPFNRWDTNKDGFLSLEEYKTDPKNGAASEARFKRFDKNNDGKVSREEFVGPSTKSQ